MTVFRREQTQFRLGMSKAIEAVCDQLLGIPVSTRNAQRLSKRYLKHRNDLFTFL